MSVGSDDPEDAVDSENDTHAKSDEGSGDRADDDSSKSGGHDSGKAGGHPNSNVEGDGSGVTAQETVGKPGTDPAAHTEKGFLDIISEKVRGIGEESAKAIVDLVHPTSQIVALPSKEPFGILKPKSEADGYDLFDEIRQKMEEKDALVVLVAGPPGTGKETAAIQASRALVRRTGACLPKDQCGVFLVSERTTLEESLALVYEWAHRAPDLPCVFVLQRPLDDHFEDWKAGALEPLKEAVRRTKSKIVAFIEGEKPWPAEVFEWAPYFDLVEVFGTRAVTADGAQVQSLLEEFGKELTGRSIRELVVLAETWEAYGHDRDLFCERLEERSDLMAGRLLGEAKNPSETVWMVAAAFLSATEDRALAEGARLLANHLQQPYVATDIAHDAFRRIGRRVRVEQDGSRAVSVGYLSDEGLARSLTARFGQIHAEPFRRFVVGLGHSSFELVQNRAAEAAAEFCATDTDLWAGVWEEWHPDRTGNMVSALLLAHAYNQETLAQRALDATYRNLVSEHPLRWLAACYAVLYGVGAKRPEWLIRRLLRSGDIRILGARLGLRIVAAHDASSTYGAAALRTLAEWEGRGQTQGKPTTRAERLETLDTITEVAEWLLPDPDTDESDFPSILYAQSVTDQAVYAMVKLLIRIFHQSDPFPIRQEQRWYRMILGIALLAQKRASRYADWFGYVAATLYSTPAGRRGETYWDAFLVWSQSQRLTPAQRDFLEDATDGLPLSDARVRYRRFGQAMASDAAPRIKEAAN